jgi:hypothetical protein
MRREEKPRSMRCAGTTVGRADLDGLSRSTWRRARRRRAIRARGQRKRRQRSDARYRGNHEGRAVRRAHQRSFPRELGSWGSGFGFGRLFRVCDRVTQLAHRFRRKRFLNRSGQRHLLRVVGNHLAPRECLHQIPLTPRGKQPRGKRKNERNFLPHRKAREKGAARKKQSFAKQSLLPRAYRPK